MSAESSKSVLHRMDQVMSAIQEQRGQTLTEVCQRTGLPRTTVHRFLDSLVEMRWLSRVGNQYEFGVRMLEMGAGEEHWFFRLAQPELMELHLRTRQTVHLTFLDGPDVVFWKKLSGREGAIIPTRFGGRRPAHLTASGKAILAAGDPELLADFSRHRLTQATPNSITTFEDLTAEIARVRREGLAHDRGESWPEVGCIARAVVAKPDGHTTVGTPMIAAISISGPRERIQASARALESALRSTCHAIETAAGRQVHRAYAS
ncbi:IclR family transcriptional regulator [Enemella sp. A6]|uniref:IclR family transcriptional regulator n=1 Tax=Enemella sp. A6 TaxID=3440152 RepID=UPI003EBEBBA6